MECTPHTRAEGGVGDAGEHKALHRAAHITPVVNYQGIQHNSDYCPHNSVDDFKSFHIHIVLVVFSFPYQAGAFLLTLSCALRFSRASFNFSVESFNFSVESCFVGRSGDSPDLEWLGF